MMLLLLQPWWSIRTAKKIGSTEKGKGKGKGQSGRRDGHLGFRNKRVRACKRATVVGLVSLNFISLEELEV